MEKIRWTFTGRGLGGEKGKQEGQKVASSYHRCHFCTRGKKLGGENKNMKNSKWSAHITAVSPSLQFTPLEKLLS